MINFYDIQKRLTDAFPYLTPTLKGIAVYPIHYDSGQLLHNKIEMEIDWGCYREIEKPSFNENEDFVNWLQSW